MATAKPTKTVTKPADASEAVTLDQALKEEGEGRTPETISQGEKKPSGPSKADLARKIMEEMWDGSTGRQAQAQGCHPAVRE